MLVLIVWYNLDFFDLSSLSISYSPTHLWIEVLEQFFVLKVLQLQEEKASLSEDKKRLLERLQEDPLTGTSQLRRQIDSLKEQIFKIETCKNSSFNKSIYINVKIMY